MDEERIPIKKTGNNISTSKENVAAIKPKTNGHMMTSRPARIVLLVGGSQRHAWCSAGLANPWGTARWKSGKSGKIRTNYLQSRLRAVDYELTSNKATCCRCLQVRFTRLLD